MSRKRVFPLVGLFSLVVFLAGCATGGGFVVVSPEMKQATVPEGKYQGVHAVYLYDVGYVHFDPFDIGNTYYPSYVYTRFAKIKLLTRSATEGGRYGNIRIFHVDELLSKDAYVIKPDGTQNKLTEGDYVTTILVKDIIPDAHPPIHFYETQIIFPGLAPGDTIVYQYTMRGRELMWDFNHVDAPVLYSKFMAARPLQRSEIQPVIYDRHDLKPEKSVEKGIATGMMGYVGSRQAEWDIWETKDVPSITGEIAIPPAVDLASRVRVWQGDRRWDWGTLGTTYYKWFTHYGRYPSLAKDLAQEATKGIVAPREKAKAIHDWVKKNINIQDMPQLTYVPRAIEISRFDLDDLIKEKNANPERAASLMWLMMQAVGVDATLVLAVHEDYPRALEDLPYLYQFTHPLLALDDGTLIDTTNRLCPFGMIPWEFEGRKGLWIKGESVSWRDIPASQSVDNKKEVTVSGEVEPEGDVKVSVKFKLSGQMAYAYRRIYAPKKPKEVEDSMRATAACAADKAELQKYEFKNIEDVDKPLEIEFDYKVPHYAELLQDRMVMKAGAFVNQTECPVMAPQTAQELAICPKPMGETRSNPVKFPFSRLDEMDINVTFPKTMLLQALPKGFRTREISKGTSLGVQTSYGSDGGKNLHVIRKFSVNQPFVDKKGYSKLRDIVRRYEVQKDTLITLELPKMAD